MKLKSLSTIHIGYTDAAKEGHWVWTDGIPGSYRHWSKSEPNNYREEDCAILSLFWNNEVWFDRNCDIVRHYICQKAGNYPFLTKEHFFLNVCFLL